MNWKLFKEELPEQDKPLFVTDWVEVYVLLGLQKNPTFGYLGIEEYAKNFPDEGWMYVVLPEIPEHLKRQKAQK